MLVLVVLAMACHCTIFEETLLATSYLETTLAAGGHHFDRHTKLLAMALHQGKFQETP
jgi:hypothetical protein